MADWDAHGLVRFAGTGGAIEFEPQLVQNPCMVNKIVQEGWV